MRLFTLALVLFITSAAHAQPLPEEIENALTKLLVGEAGWDHPLDHEAILHAIHLLDTRERRSTNVLETMSFHIPWWKRGYPPKRPWVAHLDTTCEEPDLFPHKLKWENLQRYCFQIVRRVRMYYAGRIANPCKGTPDNWRARGKPSRRAKRKYFQIGCGRKSLHNWFDTRRKPHATRPNKKRTRRTRP